MECMCRPHRGAPADVPVQASSWSLSVFESPSQCTSPDQASSKGILQPFQETLSLGLPPNSDGLHLLAMASNLIKQILLDPWYKVLYK